MNGSHELNDVAHSGGDHAVPERDPSTSTAEPRVDPGRPADPKAAELRAEKNPLKRFGKAEMTGRHDGVSLRQHSGQVRVVWARGRTAAEDRRGHVRRPWWSALERRLQRQDPVGSGRKGGSHDHE